MTSQAGSVQQYINELDASRKDWVNAIRQKVLHNLPTGFEEVMNYGMIGYVVPHSVYPAGYHCDPALPLPFMALASQKNSVNFYHMGIYADAGLLNWFTTSYAGLKLGKLDMGKSCMRFKKPEQTPLDLIGELVSKMAVADWISLYEQSLKSTSKKP
jgi:hypothetical protein